MIIGKEKESETLNFMQCYQRKYAELKENLKWKEL
jgi:hypothetical protein